MPLFRFTLEPLLRLRRHAEDQRKRELGEAMRAKEEAERAVSLLEEEREEVIAAAAKEGEPFDALMRKQLTAFLYRLGEKIRVAEAAVLEKENDIIAATEALRKAMQERKILERLRELRKQEHQIQANRQEQKALDEHAAHFLRRENAARLAHGESV